MISLDGNVPTLSDTVFEFDLDSDGEQDLINFTSAGSGFLAFDKNEDQVINNGSELFGPGTGNGFNELSAFDDDQNRWIDENDAVFSKLTVWTKDATGKDRLISLKDAGIGAIALDHADTLFNIKDVDNQLNGQMKQSGIFLFENGNIGSLHQVDLVSHAPETQAVVEQPAATPEQTPTDEPAIGPEFLSVPPTGLAQASAPPNPLQELLDRIEELKEKLSAFMDKMNPVHGRKRGPKGRHRSYDYFRPDPSILISGRNRSPVRSRRWHA